MNIDSKLRPVYLARILFDRTDKDHYLTTNQLIQILKEEYGIESYRITVRNDIRLLQEIGMDIDAELSTNMRYRMLNRKFDVAELKLLIDAVESSKFISKKTGKALVEKLMKEASGYQAESLKRNLLAEGRVKSENEKDMQILDAVNEAINKGKKISFKMIEYSPKKRRILHNDGEEYIFSPYSLVWDGDCYYMVGFSDKYGRVGSHRVDRVAGCPKILKEDQEKPPKGFRLETYINTMFRMFDSERVKVELLCENDVMDALVDKFGTGFRVTAVDEEHFKATVEIAASHIFYSWVFGFGGKVKIASPKEVKEKYREMARKAAEEV